MKKYAIPVISIVTLSIIVFFVFNKQETGLNANGDLDQEILIYPLV
jgi:hypothetical protein